jgi:hypothetical protein
MGWIGAKLGNGEPAYRADGERSDLWSLGHSGAVA